MTLRSAFTICVLLVIGALINISIAWAFCYYAPPGSSPIQRVGNVPTGSGECLTFCIVSQPGIQRVDWMAGVEVARHDRPGGVGRFTAPAWCWVPSQGGFQRQNVPGHQPNTQWIEAGAGWPLLSMRWCLLKTEAPPAPSSFPTQPPFQIMHPSSSRIVFQPPPQSANGAVTLTPRRGAIHLADAPAAVMSLPRLRVLPIDPIWLGFVGNTLFYASILWLIVSLKPLFRRHRLKRGLCPACAYPIGVSAVCTECGQPLPSQHALK